MNHDVDALRPLISAEGSMQIRRFVNWALDPETQILSDLDLHRIRKAARHGQTEAEARVFVDTFADCLVASYVRISGLGAAERCFIVHPDISRQIRLAVAARLTALVATEYADAVVADFGLKSAMNLVAQLDRTLFAAYAEIITELARA